MDKGLEILNSIKTEYFENGIKDIKYGVENCLAGTKFESFVIKKLVFLKI